jgi:hypothetical protein
VLNAIKSCNFVTTFVTSFFIKGTLSGKLTNSSTILGNTLDKVNIIKIINIIYSIKTIELIEMILFNIFLILFLEINLSIYLSIFHFIKNQRDENKYAKIKVRKNINIKSESI